MVLLWALLQVQLGGAACALHMTCSQTMQEMVLLVLQLAAEARAWG